MKRADDDDDDEGPVDEVAMAASLRRLDELAKKHPELLGPSGPDNVSAWMETLKSIEEGTDMAKEPTTQVAFRLPDSLIARLDRHVERMSQEHPGGWTSPAPTRCARCRPARSTRLRDRARPRSAGGVARGLEPPAFWVRGP